MATPAPRERAEDWRTAGGSPGLEARNARPAQGAHEGGRREKGCSRGVGWGPWGRGTLPGLSLTASFASRPRLRGSPRSGASRSRLLPRLKDQSRCTKMGRGRREPRERGEQARGGWGRWDARSGRRGHLRHDRRRLHSATEAAGPPTTPGPASAPPPAGERRPCRPIRSPAQSKLAGLRGRSQKEEERGRLVRRRDFS